MEISEDSNLEISTPTVDKLGRSYATGKRKNAVARVWIKNGTGKVLINGKDSNKYFSRPVLNMLVYQAIKSIELWTGISPSFDDMYNKCKEILEGKLNNE